MTRGIPDLTDPRPTSRVDVGEGLAILTYADGTMRFRHRCDRPGRGTHGFVRAGTWESA